MKKLLGLFAGVAILGSGISNVTSCGLGYSMTPTPPSNTDITADFSSSAVKLSKNLKKTNVDLTLSKMVSKIEEVEISSTAEQYISVTASKINTVTKKATINLEIIGEPLMDIEDIITVSYNDIVVGSFSIVVQSFSTEEVVNIEIENPQVDLSFENKTKTVDLAWSSLIDTTNLEVTSNKNNSAINVINEQIDQSSLKSKLNLVLVDFPTEDTTETLTLSFDGKTMGTITVFIKGHVEETEEVVDDTITSEFEKNIFNFSTATKTLTSKITLSNVITNNTELNFSVGSELQSYLQVSTTQIDVTTKTSTITAKLVSVPTQNESGSIKVSYGGKVLGEIGVNISPDNTEFKATFSKNQIRVAKDNWSDSIRVNFSKLIGSNKNLTITSNLGSKGYINFKADQIDSQAMGATIDLSIAQLPSEIANEILTVEYAGIIVGKITIDLYASQSSDELILSSTKVNFSDLTPIKIEVINFAYITGEVSAEYKTWNDNFLIDVDRLVTDGYFMAKMVKIPDQAMEAIINVQVYSNKSIAPAYVHLSYNPETK